MCPANLSRRHIVLQVGRPRRKRQMELFLPKGDLCLYNCRCVGEERRNEARRITDISFFFLSSATSAAHIVVN